jgi:hypothetical protein
MELLNTRWGGQNMRLAKVSRWIYTIAEVKLT